MLRSTLKAVGIGGPTIRKGLISWADFEIPAAPIYRVWAGQYTGNGNSTQAISVPFAPVWVTAGGFALSYTASSVSVPNAWRTDSTGGFATTHITAMGASSFTVGASLNGNSTTYSYFVLGGAPIEVGTYTGTGADNRNIATVMTTPNFVMVGHNDASVVSSVIWWTAPGGDAAEDWAGSLGGLTADYIQGVSTNAFQVGTKLDTSGKTYYWVAIENELGDLTTGSYSGNNADPASIAPSDSFQPALVFLTSIRVGGGTGSPVSWPALGTDKSFEIGFNNLQSDFIKAFNSNGFSVGLQSNGTGTNYAYLMVRNVFSS